MTKHKNTYARRKLRRIIENFLIVIVIIAIGSVAFVYLLRQSVDQMIRDEFNRPPSPWYECTFEYADNSTKVTLMRTPLAGWHYEYGIRVRLADDNKVSDLISLIYTEQSNTDFYQSTATLNNGQTIPILHIESYAGDFYINLLDFKELGYQDFYEEENTVYLGYFDEVKAFVSNDTSIARQSGECDRLSTIE